MATLTVDELEKLTREIASLSRAGIPVSDGLRRVSREAASARYVRLSNQLADGLDEGLSLGQAFAKCTPTPSPDFVALVECAEAATDFQQAIDIIVNHARRHRRQRALITSSLIYPIIMVMFCTLLVYFIAIFIVPRFEDVFVRLGVELPTLTLFMVGISNQLQGATGVLFAILIFGPCIAFLFSIHFREMAFSVMRVFPTYRYILANSDTALMARFLSLMLQRGVELPRILAVAAAAAWDPRTRHEINIMKNRATQGLPLSDALPSLMPATAAWIFRNGEQRGQLAEACESVAELCEERFELVNLRITVFLEPIIIVMVGLIMAGVIIGLYLPIFSIPRLVSM